MNPLQRLYRTKLALLATICTALGGALLFLARWADGQPHWDWLGNLPAADIGSALFSGYVLPFEVVSVLLLAALIGAVVIARKDERDDAATQGEPRGAARGART